MSKLDKQPQKKEKEKSVKVSINIERLLAEILLVIFILILAIIIVTEILNGDTEHEVTTKSVKGLNTEDGTFVLGVKDLESKDVINLSKYYIYIQKDKGYVLEWIYINDIEIVTTTEEPYIEGVFKEDGTIYKPDLDTFISEGLDSKYSEYTLYLPEDYILKDMETMLKESRQEEYKDGLLRYPLSNVRV